MPSAPRASLALVTTLALLLGLAVGPVPAPPAQATTTTATLTGRVIMPVGLAVPTGFGGLSVSSVVQIDGTLTFLRSARVAADGTFSITGLAPGEHRIRIGGTYINTITMYHDRAFRYSETTPVVLSAGANTIPDIQLYRGGQIHGSVLGFDGSDVGSGSIHVVSAPPAYAETGASRIAYFADHSDHYTVSKLPPGDYIIQFVPATTNIGWYGAFSGNARQLVDAVPVTVGFDESVTEANIQLVQTPGISGVYTAVRHSSVTGSEPNSITVRPFPGTTAGDTRHLFLEDQGPFRVPGLAPGAYQVCSSLGLQIDPDPAKRSCHGQSAEHPDGVPIVVDEVGSRVTAVLDIVIPGMIIVTGLVHPAPSEPGGFATPSAVFAKYWRFDETQRSWVLQAEASRIGGGDNVDSSQVLPPGQYRVEVSYRDLSDREYREYWPGGVTRFVDAEIVTLLQGERKVLSGMTLQPDGIGRTRLSGADRFATAVALSKSEYPSGSRPVVFIANGLNYPDALAAGPAAAALGGPLLLVTPTAAPAVVQAELDRLDPSSIVIVGGEGSVSTQVETLLQSFVDAPGDVIRLAGSDRYGTSRQVVDEVFGDSRGSVVFIATGSNYPDALASGAAASAYGGPVLLVNGGQNGLDAPTRALLDRLSPSLIVIAGGRSAVSSGIEAELTSRYEVGNHFVIRLAGSDRYSTALAINQLFEEADSVYIASGAGFADALAAGPIAGMTGSPLYLASATCVPSGVLGDLDYIGARNLVVVGGQAVLSDRVLAGTPC